MTRKLTLFDQTNIVQPLDSIGVEQTAAPVSEASGIAETADSIENVTLDTSNFTMMNDPLGPIRDEIGSWSAPEVPQRFSESDVVESPQIAPEGDGPDVPARRFDIESTLQIIEGTDAPSPDAATGGVTGNQQTNGLPDLGFIRHGWSAPPDIPLKDLITSDTSLIPTEVHHAGESAIDRAKMSIGQFLPGSPLDSLVGRIDSNYTSPISDQQLVEDLLKKIQQSLLSVPQEQQSYWQNLFEEKIKSYFYTPRLDSEASLANMVRSMFGDPAHASPIYYPRENVNWEAAVQDFETFLEQLQAVQQPTEVQAAGDPQPEG